MKKVSLYAFLLASVYTPAVYAKIEAQPVEILSDHNDLLTRLKGQSPYLFEGSVDPYMAFLKLIGTSELSLGSVRESSSSKKQEPYINAFEGLLRPQVKLSGKSVSSAPESLILRESTEVSRLSSAPELAGGNSGLQGISDRFGERVFTLTTTVEEPSSNSQGVDFTSPIVLDVRESELFGAFERAFERLQFNPTVNMEEVLGAVSEEILENGSALIYNDTRLPEEAVLRQIDSETPIDFSERSILVPETKSVDKGSLPLISSESVSVSGNLIPSADSSKLESVTEVEEVSIDKGALPLVSSESVSVAGDLTATTDSSKLESVTEIEDVSIDKGALPLISSESVSVAGIEEVSNENPIISRRGPPPAPKFFAPVIKLSGGTEKKILSIADVIRESLSRGEIQLRSSHSSREGQEEETFNLGAMGTISGKEASALARRMAKLREEAEKNVLESQGTKEELPRVAPKSNNAPLTWKKTGPAKVVFKRNTDKTFMSLADALKGGVKLKSASGNATPGKSLSQDNPKDALRNALKSALSGGLKLRSVQDRVAQEKLNEDERPKFNFNLKSTSRDSSSKGETEGDFFSQNPILKKLREKALRQEQEEQRRLEEEERRVLENTKGPSEEIHVRDLSGESSPLITEQEVRVEKDLHQPTTLIEPVISGIITENEPTLPQEKQEVLQPGDLFSSLMNKMNQFVSFSDEEDDSQNDENDGWDDEEDEALLPTLTPKKQELEEIVAPVTQNQASVGKIKIAPAKRGMGFLDQIKLLRKKDEPTVDESVIQKAIERERERKAAQEELLRKQEEERRSKEYQALARIEQVKQEAIFNDLTKGLLARRGAISGGNGAVDDEDDDWEDF